MNTYDVTYTFTDDTSFKCTGIKSELSLEAFVQEQTSRPFVCNINQDGKYAKVSTVANLKYFEVFKVD